MMALNESVDVHGVRREMRKADMIGRWQKS